MIKQIKDVVEGDTHNMFCSIMGEWALCTYKFFFWRNSVECKKL